MSLLFFYCEPALINVTVYAHSIDGREDDTLKGDYKDGRAVAVRD